MQETTTDRPQKTRTLSPDEIQKYGNTAAANLTPECAYWLATGSLREPS